MASGWTDKGFTQVLDIALRGATAPTNLYVALVTSATAPTNATNTLSQLTEIAAGNGYTTGGFQLSLNSTDFDVLTEADPVVLQIKDVAWTASGGPIPSSGDGASYAVLTDDNGTVGSREIWAWWDLTTARSVTDTNALTLQNLQLNGDV